MNLAAIDIGTNSVRLLVAECAKGTFIPVYRGLVTTRLGLGLAQSGRLSPSGRERTREAIGQFVGTARKYQAEKMILFGTSAMREAADGPEFARRLTGEYGQQTKIISAATEAQWSYLGVEKSLPQCVDPLVFDLGGGSCELTWMENGHLRSRSKKIGAVYLSDRFLCHDPPLPEEAGHARRFVRAELEDCPLPGKPLVGVGGTVTTLAAMAQKLSVYDPQKVHGFQLFAPVVHTLLVQVLAVPTEERMNLPGMHRERAAIIPAGVLVVDTLLTLLQAGFLIVSEGDILLGSLYASADQHQPGSQCQ